MAVTFNVEGRVLVVDGAGEWSPEDSALVSATAPQMMEEHSLSRMLLDLSDAPEHGTDNAAYISRATSEMTGLYRAGMAIAVVNRTVDPTLGVLFETIARNRGIRAKVFTDRAKAMTWLL